MENRFELDDLGVPPFQETPINGLVLYVYIQIPSAPNIVW